MKDRRKDQDSSDLEENPTSVQKLNLMIRHLKKSQIIFCQCKHLEIQNEFCIPENRYLKKADIFVGGRYIIKAKQWYNRKVKQSTNQIVNLAELGLTKMGLI